MGGIKMKNLIAFVFILLCFQLPRAQDIFNQPFSYLSAPRPAQDASSQVGVWWIKPTMIQSWIGITNDSEKYLTAEFLNGTGAGVSWQRTIIVKGEYYQTLGIAASGLFTPIVGAQTSIRFAGALTISLLNGWIGGGVRFDGKKVSGIMTTNFNLL